MEEGTSQLQSGPGRSSGSKGKRKDAGRTERRQEVGVAGQRTECIFTCPQGWEGMWSGQGTGSQCPA